MIYVLARIMNSSLSVEFVILFLKFSNRNHQHIIFQLRIQYWLLLHSKMSKYITFLFALILIFAKFYYFFNNLLIAFLLNPLPELFFATECRGSQRCIHNWRTIGSCRWFLVLKQNRKFKAYTGVHYSSRYINHLWKNTRVLSTFLFRPLVEEIFWIGTKVILG